MGFHRCEYCLVDPHGRVHTSSGDNYLRFTSGRLWAMPDMIIHYIEDHNYQPPQVFIDDITNGVFVEPKPNTNQRDYAEGAEYIQVGYLAGDFQKGPVPPEFLVKLHGYLDRENQANHIGTRGLRRQTKGLANQGKAVRRQTRSAGR